MLKRVWEADRAEIIEIYAGPAPVGARFREHLEWLGSSQKELYDKYGLVPGTFDMVMDINIPSEVVAFVRAARAEHLDFLSHAVSQMLAAEQAMLVPWLAGGDHAFHFGRADRCAFAQCAGAAGDAARLRLQIRRACQGGRGRGSLKRDRLRFVHLSEPQREAPSDDDRLPCDKPGDTQMSRNCCRCAESRYSFISMIFPSRMTNSE